MMTLLGTEYHVLQVGVSPNPIQTLLVSFAQCDDPPIFPPVLIRALGERFNAPYAALRLLEMRKESLMDGLSSDEPAPTRLNTTPFDQYPICLSSSISRLSPANQIKLEIGPINSALCDLYLFLGETYHFFFLIYFTPFHFIVFLTETNFLIRDIWIKEREVIFAVYSFMFAFEATESLFMRTECSNEVNGTSFFPS